ncbi:MAG: TM2 domain-containing protein [Verrucomicrobiota bacterium]|nr:TM2 domain-containing protein [Verrucomicrobiota bacterium]
MKGTILDYSVRENKGVITGDNGERYNFSGEQWKAPATPLRGQRVDFVAKESDMAVEVYLQIGSTPSSTTEKDKITAVLLCFFLGAFGAHKFYLGMKGPAIAMLLISTLGAIFYLIPPLVMSIIAFIEFVIYLTKSEDDFQRIYVEGHRKWF